MYHLFLQIFTITQKYFLSADRESFIFMCFYASCGRISWLFNWALTFQSLLKLHTAEGDGESEVWTNNTSAAAGSSDSGSLDIFASQSISISQWMCHSASSFTDANNKSSGSPGGVQSVNKKQHSLDKTEWFTTSLNSLHGLNVSCQKEQTSSLMVQVMMRKMTCFSLRKTQGDEVTPASTTQSWTRPGAPPTPPPSTRCVTATSNGKVATSSEWRYRLQRWWWWWWWWWWLVLLCFLRLVPPLLQGKSVQMPERCVPVDKCGTHSPLWLAGPHLKRRQGIVTCRVCGHWKKNCCAFRSTPILVKKCHGNYYVYKFTQLTSCYLAYCAGMNEVISPTLDFWVWMEKFFSQHFIKMFLQLGSLCYSYNRGVLKLQKLNIVFVPFGLKLCLSPLTLKWRRI